MKKNNTLLWVLALVGVGAGVYYFTRPKVTEETKVKISDAVNKTQQSALDKIKARQEAALKATLKNIKITG